MKVLEDRSYTKEHEWAKVDDDDDGVVVVGITDYAQEQLGDVVMVELPEVGDTIDSGDVCGAVESPKSVSDLFSPVAGEVIEVNEDLVDAPEKVNESPYEEGWICKLRMSDPSELDGLMNAEAYTAFVDSLED